MIVQITINRAPDEGEDAVALTETPSLPYGVGTTVATFDYDPESRETWKYLYDLQESLFTLFRHEMTKAEIFSNEEKETNDG